MCCVASLRFLRRKDRDLNVNDYPHLFYPEVYLLDGGYKSFHEQFADLCSPVGYVSMLHADHSDDLKYYRAKSLTWSNDKTRLPSKIKWILVLWLFYIKMESNYKC